MRVGGNVEILGLAPEQQVPHPAADQEGLVPGVAQPVHDLEGVLGDLLAREMLCSGRGMILGRVSVPVAALANPCPPV
jgi:hypothetical protein